MINQHQINVFFMRTNNKLSIPEILDKTFLLWCYTTKHKMSVVKSPTSSHYSHRSSFIINLLLTKKLLFHIWVKHSVDPP